MRTIGVIKPQAIHGIFCILLGLYLIVGFSIYRDYGVPIDEYSQIELGRVNYERIVTGSRELDTNFDRYYGPAFEVMLHAVSPPVEQILHIDLMSSRHLGVYIFFAGSLVFFYLLLWKTFENPIYGLAGVILLAATPRIFAESFYNTKDIPFLATGIILLYSLQRQFRMTKSALIIHALISGFANAIRPQGLFFMLVSLITVWLGSKKSNKQKTIWTFSYVALSLVFTFFLFPIFWDGGLHAVAGFFQRSLNPTGVPTYFFGKYYVSPHIPITYIPVIISITGLLSVVVLSIVGGAWFVRCQIKHRFKFLKQQSILVAMWLTVFGSIATAIVLHSRTYDGWRHLYYIYPSMIGLTLFAVQNFRKIMKKIMIALIIVDVVLSVGFMIRNHPYEYVYYNILAVGYPNVRQNFDLDYWGISYKQILEHLEVLPSPAKIYIAEVDAFPYVTNVMIPALQKRNFSIVNSADSADVIVLINRYKKIMPKSGWKKVFAVSVDGTDLSVVYATGAHTDRL